MYDGSRHGFSWNDHFGGESVVTRNLVFNQMKESRVGGPWNDWDRSGERRTPLARVDSPDLTGMVIAYYQRSRCSARGAVSVWPGYNTISRNFFVNGYDMQRFKLSHPCHSVDGTLSQVRRPR